MTPWDFIVRWAPREREACNHFLRDLIELLGGLRATARLESERTPLLCARLAEWPQDPEHYDERGSEPA